MTAVLVVFLAIEVITLPIVHLLQPGQRRRGLLRPPTDWPATKRCPRYRIREDL